MTQFMEAPIFEADQHMDEKYSRAVQFAQLGRHTRIAINGVISDFIPNPTFERVAAPGAHEKFFAGDNRRASPCARCRARPSNPGREARWQRSAEPWRGQPHHVVAPEGFDQRTPDGVRFRIAMYQNRSHGRDRGIRTQLDEHRGGQGCAESSRGRD